MLHKILFAGPVGAGKTSAIAVVSDSGVVQTEARASDDVKARKPRTTVAMDYGTLRLDQDATIQLLGTPGQPRFEFMWEILAEGALGVVILIDNLRPDPLADLDFYLHSFRGLTQQSGKAAVIGVTRMDMGGPPLSKYRKHLAESGRRIPVLEVDARRRDDVKIVLLSLTAMLDPTTRRFH